MVLVSWLQEFDDQGYFYSPNGLKSEKTWVKAPGYFCDETYL